MIAVDRGSGMSWASQVTRKGNCAFAVQGLTAFILSLGYPRLVIQHDQEVSTRNLAELVHKSVLQVNGSLSITMRDSPVESHQSNGAAERAVRTTLLKAVQRQSHAPVTAHDSPWLSWAL